MPVSCLCLHSTLALVIDLFGGDNFVDDCLEEVALPSHPGWKTGDVQLLVANGIIQRQPAVRTQRAKHHGEEEVAKGGGHKRRSWLWEEGWDERRRQRERETPERDTNTMTDTKPLVSS